MLLVLNDFNTAYVASNYPTANALHLFVAFMTFRAITSLLSYCRGICASAFCRALALVSLACICWPNLILPLGENWHITEYVVHTCFIIVNILVLLAISSHRFHEWMRGDKRTHPPLS